MIDFLLQEKVLYSVAPLAAIGVSLILREITDYYNRKETGMKYRGQEIDWTRAIGLVFIISLGCSTTYYFFTGIYNLAVRIVGGLW